MEKQIYNIAQNQSFVQIEIGSKIEPYEYSPISEILLFTIFIIINILKLLLNYKLKIWKFCK